MKQALFALFILGASCSPTPQVHESGVISSPRTFAFKNFVELTVEAHSVKFERQEFNVHDGNAARVPYMELRVFLASGEVVASDQEVGSAALRIAGVVHEGSAFRLNENGTVDVIPASGAGSPKKR